MLSNKEKEEIYYLLDGSPTICEKCHRKNCYYIGERFNSEEGECSTYICIKCHPKLWMREFKRSLKDELKKIALTEQSCDKKWKEKIENWTKQMDKLSFTGKDFDGKKMYAIYIEKWNMMKKELLEGDK